VAGNVNKEIRLQQMQELANAQCKELMKEKYAIGAFLFGSAVSGDIHEESDLDLAIVYNTVAADIQVGKEERKIDDVRVEVWRYPIAPFIETFENEKLRNKPDTWMWTSLWVEYMQTCKILADPTKRLAKWKTNAIKWMWRESEIKPAIKQAEDNLLSSEGYLTKKNSFYSLICLREALTCLSAAHIMKNDLIPSFRPKELSLKLRQIMNKEKNLLDVFDLVNDADALNYNLVEDLQLRLKEFVDTEWGTKRLGPRTELENAKSCLRKRDFIGAMLSLRYSAYWLGFHIINKQQGVKLKAEICNGENHAEMINQVATASRSFYEFYKQLQFAEKWDLKKLETTLSQARAVLDFWQE